jgi:hypothetical protein
MAGFGAAGQGREQQHGLWNPGTHSDQARETKTVDVRLDFTGTTALLTHNVALSDPDFPITKAIAVLTAKKGKSRTEDDRREIERLEWYGGLYIENDRVVMPAANIRKTLINAAKASRQGKQMERALQFHELNVPLEYGGPVDIGTLWMDTTYRHRTMAKVSGRMIVRVRPQFPQWSLGATAMLLEEVMDPVDLQRIADRAGIAEGLGDNRANGYGRFTVKVVEL